MSKVSLDGSNGFVRYVVVHHLPFTVREVKGLSLRHRPVQFTVRVPVCHSVVVSSLKRSRKVLPGVCRVNHVFPTFDFEEKERGSVWHFDISTRP